MSGSVRDLLAREAAEAEAVAEAEERDDATPQRGHRGRRQAVDPAQVYAVRIPVSRLKDLRRLADRLGVAPSSLLRQWVLENLDRHAHDEEEAVDVAPREGLAERSSGRVNLGRSRRTPLPDRTDDDRTPAPDRTVAAPCTTGARGHA